MSNNKLVDYTVELLQDYTRAGQELDTLTGAFCNFYPCATKQDLLSCLVSMRNLLEWHRLRHTEILSCINDCMEELT